MGTSPPPDVLRRLIEEPVVWLTTLRPDGSPHVTPVWFHFTEQVWWVVTAADNVKVRNLRRDARVALALPDGRQPVVAEGVARLRTSEFPPAVVQAFQCKYGWAIEVPTSDSGNVLIDVPVTRWLRCGTAG